MRTDDPNVIYADELAARLGYTTDAFRRHIDRLIVEAFMPSPLLPFGRRRWARKAIETWLASDPARRERLAKAANDQAAPLTPSTVEEWGRRLDKLYTR